MAGGGDPKWQKDAGDQNFDYMFKLLIIGNSSVGKTRYVYFALGILDLYILTFQHMKHIL